MLRKNLFLLFITLFSIHGCGSLPSLDEVLPDNRDRYQKSRTLPDLEVPPDLTSDALNDPLVIPDEEDANTLSEFQRRKLMREGGQLSDAEMALLNNANEKWLAVQGTPLTVWPKLREFWLAKGYALDLDDAELGVMETMYMDVTVDDVVTFREKFMIFSEEGGAAGNLILFLSSERQERISGGEGYDDWIGMESSDEYEKQIIGELNLHFYGASETASSTSSSSGSKRTGGSINRAIRAEILSAGEDKEYLTIPEEFSRAWRNIEDAISKSGMYIDKKDKEKGIYTVLYFADTDEEKKGFLSKLKFWEGEDEGTEYHLSLTGVGDKTEVVVLDDEDKWSASRDASRILSMLQTHYNRLLK